MEGRNRDMEREGQCPGLRGRKGWRNPYYTTGKYL